MLKLTKVLTVVLSLGLFSAAFATPNQGMDSPLFQKVKNVLWDSGVEGKLNFQVINGAKNAQVIIEAADLYEAKLRNKNSIKTVLPEELIQVLMN